MPLPPAITVVLSTTYVLVTVVNSPGLFAVKEYCMQITGVSLPTCVLESKPYGPGPFQANTTFSGLSPYTTYNVEGWIVNEDNVSGGIATKPIRTLPERKFIAILGFLKDWP